MLIIVLGVLLISIVMGLLLTIAPNHTRLYVAAVLAVPQFHISHSHQFLTISTLWSSLCFLVPSEKLGIFDSRIVKLLSALIVTCAISLLWAPLPIDGAVDLVQTANFVYLLALASRVLRQRPKSLIILIDCISLSVFVESVLVVYFRINSLAELRFLSSPVASIFIGAQRLAGFFGASPDNVADADKAGGLWLNANTASAFLGVAGCVMIGVWNAERTRRHLAIGFGALVAVPFSGSKTGIVLLIIVPIIVVLTPLAITWRGRLILLLVMSAILTGLPSLSHAISRLVPGFSERSSSSVDTRTIIWRAADVLFHEHPIMGLGYGGWGPAFSELVGPSLPSRYPAHNLEIQEWADYGIVPALLVVAVVLYGLQICLSSAVHHRGRDGWLFRWCFGGLLWFYIHAQGDPVSIYGDPQLALLIAASIATCGSYHLAGKRIIGNITLVDYGSNNVLRRGVST